MARLVTSGAFEGSQLYPICKMKVPLLRAIESDLQNRRLFSVGEPQEDTMGLAGMPGFCSLRRRYNVDILGEAGLK